MQPILPVHIVAGVLALVFGYVALFAGKGGTRHRKSGLLFVFLAVATPRQKDVAGPRRRQHMTSNRNHSARKRQPSSAVNNPFAAAL